MKTLDNNWKPTGTAVDERNVINVREYEYIDGVWKKISTMCDTCIHKDEPWHSDACDGCCNAHSSYESIPTEKSADIPSE